MARISLASLTPWITAAAIVQGAALPAHLAERLGITRRHAGRLLRRLAAAQWLVAEGSPRRPVWRPGALRQVVQSYALEGLQEDLPWKRDFAPYFEVPPAVRRMAQHAFTELLNNAVDHSGGQRVTVSMRQTPLQLQLLVSDDGCGVFERVGQDFAIEDPQLAMLELSKGKLSSNPKRHRGHGLFFTSRLGDVFDIHANAAAFQCRSWDARSWLATRPVNRQGSTVYVAINLDTVRTLDAVLRAHSGDAQSYSFDRTRVPLHLLGLANGDGMALASRADARRVTARLAQFSCAEIDFAGITDIGQGFADELFRVFREQHPALELVPVGMAPQVAAMVRSVGT